MTSEPVIEPFIPIQRIGKYSTKRNDVTLSPIWIRNSSAIAFWRAEPRPSGPRPPSKHSRQPKLPSLVTRSVCSRDLPKKTCITSLYWHN